MNRIRQVVTRSRAIIRQDGWVALCFRVLGELCYRRVLVVVKDLAPPLTPPDPRCRWLGLADLPALCKAQPRADPADVMQRLDQGDRCAIFVEDGRIVSVLWVSLREAGSSYLGDAIPLGPEEAYYHSTYTLPEARGRGIFTTLGNSIDAVLYRDGIRRITQWLMPDNRLAYGPVFRRQFRPVGYLGWFRLGARRWRFRRTTRRFPWYAPRPRVPVPPA